MSLFKRNNPDQVMIENLESELDNRNQKIEKLEKIIKDKNLTIGMMGKDLELIKGEHADDNLRLREVETELKELKTRLEWREDGHECET